MKSLERHVMKTMIYILIDTKNRSINGCYSFRVTYYDRLHHPKQILSAFYFCYYEQCFVYDSFSKSITSLPIIFLFIMPQRPVNKEIQ